MERKYRDIVIHIEGENGGEPLSPDNFDIRDLYSLIGFVSSIIGEDRKSIDLPVTYSIERGSYVGRFSAPVEIVAKASALIGLVSAVGLDSVNPSAAASFEEIQQMAVRRHYDIGISNTYDDKSLHITPNTQFFRDTNYYTEAELFLFGKIVGYGGKDKGSIRLETNGSTLTIKADKDVLEGWVENHYGKEYALRVSVRQHVLTGDILGGSLKLIEVTDYSRKRNDAYLSKKISQATPRWEGVDVDAYLKEIREGAYV